MILKLSVNNQSVESSGITKDYKDALCEYVWNSFEANATTVTVNCVPNSLSGSAEIIIADNGDGIPYDSLSRTFGAFLDSQKNSRSLQIKTKANKGKGRFSCFSFAALAEWETIVETATGNVIYTISLENADKNQCNVSDPVPTDLTTGTKLTISGIDGICEEDVSFAQLEDTMLKTFAWYLYLNKDKNIRLAINGIDLDYQKYINTDASVDKEILISKIPFKVALIVWNEKIKENFSVYFLDQEGVVRSKDTTTFNRNTVNFNHSVFVTSPFFLGRDGITLKGKRVEIDGQTELKEYDEDKKVLKELSKEIQEVIEAGLHKHMAAQVDKAIARMEARESFPVFADDFYGQMRKKDLVQVTKEIYRIQPKIFHQLKPIQEKSLLGFLNLLLSSEERENVLSIIDEIVQLSPKQREDFASVLKRTHLENIIATIKFIEDRYRVIEVLKAIVFDYAGCANERDHIQKIVEQHYWLFGEQYHLVTADKRMQKALEEYLYLLYGDKTPDAVLTPDEEELRRMDIFACGARNTEDPSGNAVQENLVVELKAPKVMLTKTVLRQIEDYMDYVRKQPSFNSQYRKWKFVAVCTSVDDDVKARYESQKAKGKKGLVTDIDNYEIYALTWDDVFQSFNLRHAFLLDKLKTDKDAIASEIESSVNGEKSREAADGLTALVTG
ncbi:MAG: ATP-binding protein [Oscillospiraceae bacterium]|nr:ATP-binding protein [Oscillospiraceae bacterium]